MPSVHLLSRAGACWACLIAVGLAGAAEPAGLRKLAGKHLTLVTDLASDAEIDALPQLFDAAFAPWCEYFSLSAVEHADWHVTGYLMHSKERFQQAGYWRADLPAFPNGYSTGSEFWLYDQTSPYYRRHLLLHEGVHSFMYTLLGSAGPPWYLEGIAELLGAHRRHDGQLTVAYFPATRREMQQFGRMKIVQDGVAAGRPLSVAEVLAFDARAHLRTEPYGWSWALAAFLDGHPRYRERFRAAAQFVRAGNFDARFRQLYDDDWRELNAEWQVFVANLDYGYDFQRMAIDFRRGDPLPAAGATVQVATDRGWQSTGARLRAGKHYRLHASGRYQVAQKSQPWWCEAGGVTIRYYHGQPLGMLLAAVDPDEPAESAEAEPRNAGEADTPLADGSSLAHPLPAGLDTVISPRRDGTLYLRINESAARLSDNRGELTVEIAPQSDAQVSKSAAGQKLKGPAPAARGD